MLIRSMEFLKTKILRKPSKLQKKSVVRSETFLGQSMFELHRPHSGPKTRNQFQDWPLAKSSAPTSSQYCKQDVLLPSNPHHDWRQDTPFWNYSRGKRKENVINWGLNDPPPSWAPPPPSSHQRQSRDSTPMFPSVPHQAVNSMYLPPTAHNSSMYLPPTTGYPTSIDSMEGSMLEITELDRKSTRLNSSHSSVSRMPSSA